MIISYVEFPSVVLCRGGKRHEQGIGGVTIARSLRAVFHNNRNNAVVYLLDS
jgi:hypothetical protein